MDTSLDPGMTKLEEGEKHYLSQTVSCPSEELNSPNGSTFSLTMDMIQAKFDMKGVFYNKHVSSDDENEGRGSLDSEPLDFIEDGFRVDIGTISGEDDRSYFIARRSSNCSESEVSVSFEITSSEDYFNDQDSTNDVADVSFSYPSSEHIEHYHKINQIKQSASLPSLIPASHSSLLPLSVSVPSVCTVSCNRSA